VEGVDLFCGVEDAVANVHKGRNAKELGR
jgi:hypothetical protein